MSAPTSFGALAAVGAAWVWKCRLRGLSGPVKRQLKVLNTARYTARATYRRAARKMTAESDASTKSLTVEEWMLAPLYTVGGLPDNHSLGRAFRGFGSVDMYCVGCGQHSVFHDEPQVEQLVSTRPDYWQPTMRVTLSCARNRKHQILFFFAVEQEETRLVKVGQYPSIADLTFPDYKKYRPILGATRLSELTRALGLISHGVGAGAFVYLRRVFEWLVAEARKIAETEEGWDERAFDQARMDEKIQLLRSHLPDFLVQNRRMYGVLSSGVHELSDDECIAHFPVVRAGIEMILDDKLAHHARQQKIQAVQGNLQNLAQSLSGS